MLTKKHFIIGFILNILSLQCFAVQDPVVLLEKITTSVLEALKVHDDKIQDNPGKMYEVVDHLVLPHIDFIEMSKWVAGRTAWGKSTEAARNSFVKEFKVLMINTYATALLNYTTEKFEYYPQKYNVARPRVQVSSKIIRQHKDNINLDYRLIRHGDSWKVYDVIIEGISILQGFQAQFTNDIKIKGLIEVTKRIRLHNNESPGKV